MHCDPNKVMVVFQSVSNKSSFDQCFEVSVRYSLNVDHIDKPLGIDITQIPLRVYNLHQ